MPLRAAGKRYFSSQSRLPHRASHPGPGDSPALRRANRQLRPSAWALVVDGVKVSTAPSYIMASSSNLLILGQQRKMGGASQRPSHVSLGRCAGFHPSIQHPSCAVRRGLRNDIGNAGRMYGADVLAAGDSRPDQRQLRTCRSGELERRTRGSRSWRMPTGTSQLAPWRLMVRSA